MYTNAQYVANQQGENRSITVEVNGVIWSVPLDPANTDYAAILRLVEAGELVIAPASP